MTPSDSAAAGSTATEAAPAYRLTKVSKTYQQKNRQVSALNEVDLDIPRGQLVAVQGPTGGGKSTLLQMLGALDRPTAGEVSFDGRRLTGLGNAELTDFRATQIGFVFQGFNLIPTLTALDNVQAAFAGTLAATPKAEIRSRCEAALAEVGLDDRLDHLPGELSGGQQQRVAIARALVKNPAVLLADEPTGALDETTREEIIALIERQWRERGLTVVIVTHDSWIAKRAQRRLQIKKGRVREA